MKINTLKAVEYRKSHIYVRNFQNTFEWIVVHKNQLYTGHYTIYRSWWQILLGRPYTSKQLADVVNYLMATAEATVDYLQDVAGKSKKSPNLTPKLNHNGDNLQKGKS